VVPPSASPAVGLVPPNTTVKLNGRSVTLCPAIDQRGVHSAAGKAWNAGPRNDGSGRPSGRDPLLYISYRLMCGLTHVGFLISGPLRPATSLHPQTASPRSPRALAFAPRRSALY
jgi:hypothetical protein